MSERRAGHRGDEADPYDNVDAEIGEVRLWDRDWTVRLRAHIGEEAYHRGHDDEIIPLTQRRGTRTYVLGHPYLLQPNVRLNVHINREPDPSGHVGKVTSSDGTGLRHQPIGKVQALYYPFERTIILWECFLEAQYAKETPQDDPNQQAVWRGFERFLTAQFPDAVQIATTHADPLYATPDYQQFMTMMSYRPGGNRAFGKGVTQR